MSSITSSGANGTIQLVKTQNIKLDTNTPEYIFDLPYGGEYTGSNSIYSASYVQYPISSSNQVQFRSLRNAYNSYKFLNPNFVFEDLIPTNTTSVNYNLISIPSSYYGSSIKRGSVSLKFIVTGSNIAELQDIKKNGDLIQINGLLSGSTIGRVLYNEGFIVLTSSQNIDSSHQENYSGSGNMYPAWSVFAHAASQAPESSFDFEFQGVYKIPTITMLCEARKGELNYSNNPTFIDKNYASYLSQSISGSNYYEEKEDILLKNVTYSPYTNYEEAYEKQTFITRIGIYDENKKLIATAKLANPVRKTESRELTFKLKLDL